MSISIHSLRVEGDENSIVWDSAQPDFNPLPPCGGRHGNYTRKGDAIEFQSTPSVWRETLLFNSNQVDSEFQSTPSVWRETCTFRIHDT